MATFSKEDIHCVPDHPYIPAYTHCLSVQRVQEDYNSEAIIPGHMVQSLSGYTTTLHGLDASFCFVCCKFVKDGKTRLTSYTEDSFLLRGFVNWKDAKQILASMRAATFISQPLQL